MIKQTAYYLETTDFLCGFFCFSSKKNVYLQKKVMEYMLTGSFICNRCRNLCKGPCDKHIQEVIAGNITDENKDLVGRKQRIICLGKWCDNPCSEQDLTQYADVDLTPFLNLIKYLGNKCNELLEEKYANKT